MRLVWPFKKRARDTAPPAPIAPTAEQNLLAAFLETERLRLEKTTELEMQKHALEMKRHELELHELERIGEEKRKQQVFNERVREQRRENLAKGREEKKRRALAGAAGQSKLQLGCEECQAAAEGRAPSHSSDLIRHAIEKHELRAN